MKVVLQKLKMVSLMSCQTCMTFICGTQEKFRRMSQVLFFIQKKWMGTNVVKLKKDKNSFLYVIHTPFLILYTSFVWESDWNCMHLFILYSVSEPFWL